MVIAKIRSVCYDLPDDDPVKWHSMVSNTIPSIVSTASITAGLVLIEFLKVVQNKPCSDLKNGYFNTGISMMSYAQPMKPIAKCIRGNSRTFAVVARTNYS